MAVKEGARFRTGIEAGTSGDPTGYGPILSAGSPTSGTFGAGTAEAGGLAIDTTNKKLYINTGSKTVPAWTVVGSQS